MRVVITGTGLTDPGDTRSSTTRSHCFLAAYASSSSIAIGLMPVGKSCGIPNALRAGADKLTARQIERIEAGSKPVTRTSRSPSHRPGRVPALPGRTECCSRGEERPRVGQR